jgi:germination protein M
MRAWLVSLTVVILALLVVGVLVYADLDPRLRRLEREAERAPAAAPPAAPAPQPGPEPEPPPEPGQREVSVYFVRVVDGEAEMVPVTRRVPAESPAAGALAALLTGPTQAERARGLTTEIPPGTRLERVAVQDGTARAAFSPELDRGVAGSMRVTTIRRQIEQTLLQFAAVDRVTIEVDGRVDDVLQP